MTLSLMVVVPISTSLSTFDRRRPEIYMLKCRVCMNQSKAKPPPRRHVSDYPGSYSHSCSYLYLYLYPYPYPYPILYNFLNHLQYYFSIFHIYFLPSAPLVAQSPRLKGLTSIYHKVCARLFTDQSRVTYQLIHVAEKKSNCCGSVI